MLQYDDRTEIKKHHGSAITDPPEALGLGTSNYCLSIRQQPIRARLCAATDGERRTIDPPPILEVMSVDLDGAQHKIIEDKAFLVVKAELWSADMKSRCITAPRVPVDLSLLIGSLVETGSPLQDDFGHIGLLFSFSNLSIRCAGDFRLRFSLLNLESDNFNVHLAPKVISTQHLFSDTFTVYTPREFPGMSS